MDNRIKEAYKGSGGRGSGNASTASNVLGNSGVNLVTGGVTVCTPADTSFFCVLQRIFTYIGWAIFVIAILYLAYTFGSVYFGKYKGRRGGR